MSINLATSPSTPPPALGALQGKDLPLRPNGGDDLGSVSEESESLHFDTDDDLDTPSTASDSTNSNSLSSKRKKLLSRSQRNKSRGRKREEGGMNTASPQPPKEGKPLGGRHSRGGTGGRKEEEAAKAENDHLENSHHRDPLASNPGSRNASPNRRSGGEGGNAAGTTQNNKATMSMHQLIARGGGFGSMANLTSGGGGRGGGVGSVLQSARELVNDEPQLRGGPKSFRRTTSNVQEEANNMNGTILRAPHHLPSGSLNLPRNTSSNVDLNIGLPASRGSQGGNTSDGLLTPRTPHQHAANGYGTISGGETTMYDNTGRISRRSSSLGSLTSRGSANSSNMGRSGSSSGGEGAMASTARRGPPLKPGEEMRAVNGTYKIRKILQEVTTLRSQMRITNKEDIGDAQFGVLQEMKKRLEEGKEKAAAAICMIGDKISVEANEVRRPLIQLVEDLFIETDQRPGNASLFKALARVHSIDLPSIVKARGWLRSAALSGSAHYLALFLSLEPVVKDLLSSSPETGRHNTASTSSSNPCLVEELLNLCLVNAKHRYRLFHTILSVLVNQNRVWFAQRKERESLQRYFQEAFELICSSPIDPITGQVIDAGDEYDARASCLEALFSQLSHLRMPPVIQVNLLRESSKDKQTAFSRAARQGDVFILQKICQVSYVIKPRFVLLGEKEAKAKELAEQGKLKRRARTEAEILEDELQAGMMANSRRGRPGASSKKKLKIDTGDGRGGIIVNTSSNKNVDPRKFSTSGETDSDYDEEAEDYHGYFKLDINRQQSDGTTALMQAAVAGHVDCVAFLCQQQRLDVLVKHPKLGNALQIAKSRNTDPRIVKMIQQRLKDRGIDGDMEDEAAAELERKQKDGKRKKRHHGSSGSVIDGSTALKPMLIGAKPLFELVYTMVRDGVDPKMLRENNANLERTKTNLAQKMISVASPESGSSSSSGGLLHLDPPQLELLISCVDFTFRSNDRRNGSLDFLDVCFDVMNGVDWAQHVVGKKWLLDACQTSSWQFVGFILNKTPNLKDALPTDQLMECLEVCAENRTMRIPLIAEFVVENKCEVLIPMDRQAELTTFFNKFFANIASSKRSWPRENRGAQRLSILEELIQHRVIMIDAEVEDASDKRTIFTRAAEEGDVELLDLLKRTPKVVRNIDQFNSDGTNALSLAVTAGHASAVTFLLASHASISAANSAGTSVSELINDPHKASSIDPQIRQLVAHSASQRK